MKDVLLAVVFLFLGIGMGMGIHMATPDSKKAERLLLSHSLLIAECEEFLRRDQHCEIITTAKVKEE